MRTWALLGLMLCAAGPAWGASFPAPVEGDWVAPSFRFHDGVEVQGLRLHWTTVGDPKNEPVLVLHGTLGSAATALGESFGGALFGPGGALDAAKYYIIIPDALGAGKSAKPSDGMRAGFPAYNYTDMVLAQYRLVTEGLGVRHLRLLIGNSMGGMNAWLWGVTYPEFMDRLVPMASQPTAMAGRNWMMRKAMIESIRQDPEWKNGNYTVQPSSLRLSNVMFGVAFSGGTLADQALAPTTAKADQVVAERLAAPAPADANDTLYQWDASRDYDPAAQLGRIRAKVLAINSADDERNPPETGVMAEAMTHVPNGRLLLIPASAETRGHGTTGIARFYAKELAAFLAGE